MNGNESQNIKNDSLKIVGETPQRHPLLLSPNSHVEVGASPHSKKYNSILGINLNSKKHQPMKSKKKLRF